MARTRGPKGLIPYRKKRKSGAQKRKATIDPTPELLKRKADALGRSPSSATRNQSIEPLDVMLFHGLIDPGAHRAGVMFGYLRFVVYGRQRECAHLVAVIHGHLSSEDARDRLLTDDELIDKREREEASYNKACALLKSLDRSWLAAAQSVLIDGRWPDYLTRVRAIRAFKALAQVWGIREGDL